MDCGVCQFLLLLGKVYAELNIMEDRVMKGNLEGVVKYLDNMYGQFIQKVVVDPEDDELVIVYGKDSLDNSHWRVYIYMISERTELEIDDGYCVCDYDIEFFNKVYQEIETITDIYHRK